VDTRRFERLLDRAAAAGDPATRRLLLTEALRLWRGEPFEDLPSSWLADTEAPGLVERYLTAVEHRADLEMAQGRHDGLAADLARLAARHPLRESLWARLLVVLARCGRPAEALATYEAIRVRLVAELGADPGPELRRIHAGLLAGAVPAAGRTALGFRRRIE
jgi:DNA-binding SARP family transcriptional activator